MTRPVFGEPIKTAKALRRDCIQYNIEVNYDSGIERSKIYRVMTDEEFRAALLLENPTYLPGTPDKRFARNIVGIAKSSRLITDAQADYIWRMVYRYRRQINNDALIKLAREKQAGAQ